MFQRIKKLYHRWMAIGSEGLDSDTSIKHIKALADLDDEWGLHEIGYRYDTGHSIDRDSQKAIFYYKRAFEKDGSTAQYAAANIGNIYYQGRGVSVNLGKAAEWFKKAAELGHPESQYNYGLSLIGGWNNTINKEEGIFWLEKSAKSGISQATETLAIHNKEN